MYKVRGHEYRFHMDARNVACAKSRFLPVLLRAPKGRAWYWHGAYCGRRFTDIFRTRKEA